MIEEVFSPGTLAAAFIFARQSNMPVNLTAVTDVELLVIDRCELLKLMLINEKFLINFMEVISNRLIFCRKD
jgi:CRP-like cAMP-binding protein